MALGMLSGCSSIAVSLNEAEPVPIEQIYDYSFLKPDSSKENITFVRDIGILGIGGAGCTKTIYINNIKAFDLEQGQVITASLSPGIHLLRLTSGHGICPDVSISEDTHLTKGSPQVFRIFSSSNGVTSFSRIQ